MCISIQQDALTAELYVSVRDVQFVDPVPLSAAESTATSGIK